MKNPKEQTHTHIHRDTQIRTTKLFQQGYRIQDQYTKITVYLYISNKQSKNKIN